MAADGGGDVVLPDGRDFACAIGDMDSLRDPAALAARGVAVHDVPDQDTTDLEKCLLLVEAPLFLGLGFLGGRIDHHLAAMNALARHDRRPAILIGSEDLCFAAPPLLELEAERGTRVSIFPMRPVRGRVSEGLRWPVSGLELAPDGRIGVSNEALGGRIRLAFDRKGALVIMPAAMLPQVFTRLGGGAAP